MSEMDEEPTEEADETCSAASFLWLGVVELLVVMEMDDD